MRNFEQTLRNKNTTDAAGLSRDRPTSSSLGNVLRSMESDPSCLCQLGSDGKIVIGNAGDQPLVLQLLVQCYQCPLTEDFQSRLDEPSYAPADRLLLRRNDDLIGHVQVSKHIGWFQEERYPVARLQDFVVLPEYRASEYDEALLLTAESVARDEGSSLAVVRTDRPEWFANHGWSCCRGQGHSRANTRSILSHFDTPYPQQRRQSSSLEIRTWRHFELDAIERLYAQLSTQMWGTIQRNEKYWQWLVGRKAHDQILLAVEKPPKSKRSNDQQDTPESNVPETPQVLGYAIVRDSNIIEMFTLPGYSNARAQLVARACRDAIERDHHFVSLHTPAADPMHEFLVTAGGSWISDGAATTGNWMLKLLYPDRWIERFYPVLHERAREAGISRPLELDFVVGDKGYRFTLTRRSSRLEETSPAAHPHVKCDWLAFQDLLTSNLTCLEAMAQSRLWIQHESTLCTLAALFPPKLFWQSPFSLLQLG